MARYINADALIEAIKSELWDWQTLDDITATSVLKQTISDIQNAPTADVVEVVRCKDCKWFNDFGCAIRIVDESDKPKEDDFCSFGERREE